jgi:hypothetical protein
VLAGLEVLLLQVRRAATRQPTTASLPPSMAAAAAGRQPALHAAAIQQPDTTALPAHPGPEATAAPDTAEAAPTPGEPQPAAVSAPLPGMPEAGSAEAAARRQARQLYDRLTAAGQRVTGAGLGRAIGRSERYGRLLLADFRAQDEAGHPNGDGAAQAANPTGIDG